MYMQYMMCISHYVYDQSSCKIAKMGNCHVPDGPMLPFPQILHLQQKYSLYTWTANFTAVPPYDREFVSNTVVERPIVKKDNSYVHFLG